MIYFCIFTYYISIFMKGTIKSLVTEKNFGFITPEEGGDKDVFFHATGLKDVEFGDLKMGDNVEFDVEESDKGPRAINVAVVSAEAGEVAAE